MQEIYPTNWPVVVDTSDPRNQFHERALHEAQIATDVRQPGAPAPARASFVTRLRLALAGGTVVTTNEACNCPA